MKKTIVQMLIGLPGSGKSHYAREILDNHHNWVHLSSDAIAMEITPEGEERNHETVFEEMKRRAGEHIEAGQNILYDATNLIAKKRRHHIRNLKKQNVEFEAVVFLTPYEILKSRNAARTEDRVPGYVIERYIRSFQFPMKDEGYSRVVVKYDRSWLPTQFPDIRYGSMREMVLADASTYDDLMTIFNLFPAIAQNIGLEQDNHHHSFTVSQHCHEVFMNARKGVKDPYEREVISWAALLHDIGKAYTKAFRNNKGEPTEEAHFYGHEHVSMYLAYPLLLLNDFPKEFIHDVLLLIDHHMTLHGNIKASKLRNRIGEQNYTRIIKLHEADVEGHIEVSVS